MFSFYIVVLLFVFVECPPPSREAFNSSFIELIRLMLDDYCMIVGMEHNLCALKFNLVGEIETRGLFAFAEFWCGRPTH